MKRKLTGLLAAAILLTTSVFAQQTRNTDPETVKLVTSDIDLFWKAYDRATPENNLNVFRDYYLRVGSPGLKDFTKLRIHDVCGLVGTIESAPKYYAALRKPSLTVASFEPQIRASLRKLKELYPDAVFPDVYFVIGRLNSAGTTSDRGLLIGVDMFGRNEGTTLDELTDWHRAVLSSTARIPNVVAHELIHYEQKFPGGSEWTLLGKALNEGGADFVAELIAGSRVSPQIHEYGDAHERELWFDFKKEMNGTSAKNWLYQGTDAKDRPADLGYYIGYKIIESYYKNAADKRQAVREILEIKDFAAFLEKSRYEEKFK